MSRQDKRHLGLFSHLLVLALLVALAGPAQAQLTGRRWEIGFGLGSANLDSSDEDFDLDFRSDLRGGYFFSDRFELEGQLIRADAVLDTQVTAWMLNAVFNFQPSRRVVPYVLVGGGYANIEDIGLFFFNPRDDEDSAAFQLGLGSRFFVSPGGRLAVRAELSSLWLDTDFFDTDRHTSLTAGLSWALGRR